MLFVTRRVAPCIFEGLPSLRGGVFVVSPSYRLPDRPPDPCPAILAGPPTGRTHQRRLCDGRQLRWRPSLPAAGTWPAGSPAVRSLSACGRPAEGPPRGHRTTMTSAADPDVAQSSPQAGLRSDSMRSITGGSSTKAMILMGSPYHRKKNGPGAESPRARDPRSD